jgi:CheY-like chemotaxis protein
LATSLSTRNLKANDFTKDIPLIMATTESDSSQIDIAKDSGVDHFIKKPFTKDFLFETIIKYLI